MQKNKYLIILNFFLILLLINVSFSININSQEYIKLKIDNKINFKIEQTSNAKVEFFYLTSSFFPKSYENVQYLNNFTTTNNNYEVINESSNIKIKYNYNKDTLKSENEIYEQFILESVAYTPKIKYKEQYPIRNIKNENKKYLEFMNLIDINEDIKNRATKIADGEDDVYIVASKVAKWIKEDINYDLKTALANPNQKSSDVFKSKAGVCKEISNLFISMMRSLGVPTRIVTGYAYTESEELVELLDSNWGGHAWAEVLIGDVWVPFDLTYDQYGHLDSTHLILDKSVDIKNSLISINASGRDFNIMKNSLNSSTKFKILEIRDKINNVDINNNNNNFANDENKAYNIIVDGPNKIGFDSYGYINVKIENKKDYYQTLFLTIKKPQEIKLLNKDNMMIILKPNEKKNVTFRYKIPNLDRGYYYTFPFNIKNEQYNLEYNISVKEEYAKINENDLPKLEIEEKIYSKNNLDFNCESKLDFPKNRITCFVKNTNNYEIKNINICLKTKCENINLKINENKNISFKTLNFDERINYNYENKSYVYDVNIEKPRIEYTKKINETNLEISYNILNFQDDLSLNIYNNNILINSSDKNKDDLNLNLNIGDNNITIKLELKQNIYDEKKFKINLIEENTNIIEQIIEWIKSLFNL